LWIDLVLLVRGQLDQEASGFCVLRPRKLGGSGGFFEEDVDGLPGGNSRRIGGGIIRVPAALESNCINTFCKQVAMTETA
jgi:hypothetical protein